MSLENLKKKVKIKRPSKEPFWKGPEEEGITFSLLSRFLVCRERFRILTICGIRPAETWNHRFEFGTMWHICEEYMAKGESWEEPLSAYVKESGNTYPLARAEINKWYNVVKITFPLYVEYWKKHEFVKHRKPLFQEQVFTVPYQLPCGRVVKLRGMFDSVDMVKGKGIYLKENKTAGDVDTFEVERKLKADLQTMLYLTVLHRFKELAHRRGKVPGVFPPASEIPEEFKLRPIRGVIYNVVRRPLSGGVGSIRQKKPTKSNPRGETPEEYYSRLQGIIEENQDTYFHRWLVDITQEDVQRFRKTVLDPILTQLCDWYEWIVSPCGWEDPFFQPPKFIDETHYGIHWMHPFGVYNVLNEGGYTELDSYVFDGNMVGMENVKTLFGELEK